MAGHPTSARNSHFLKTPDEVLDIIFGRCGTRELKALRLVSSKCERFAASHLFRTFILYPHRHSFRLLSFVSKSERICHHVQTLLYDARWRGIVAMVLAFLAKGDNAEHDPIATKKAFTQRMREVDSQALQSDNVSHQLTLMGVLEEMFQSMVSLKHIIVDEGLWETITELSQQVLQIPQFYQHLIHGYEEHLGPLNLADSADDDHSLREYPCALSLLAAARKLPARLESFHVNNTDWHASFDQLYMFTYPDIYAPSLKHVKHIDFSLGPQQCRHIRSWTIVENLQQMLQLAVNIESLVLVLRNDEQGLTRRPKTRRIYDSNHGLFPQSMFQLAGSSPNTPRFSLTRLTWSSKIAQLTIQGLACTATELRNVLSHCVTSLKELNLSSLIVLPKSPEGPRACLVKLVKWIESDMHLDRVCFDVYVTNGGTQNWFIKPSIELNHLYYQVMRFMIRGGLCPLDYVEILDGYFDLGKPEWTEHIPWMLKDERYWGDESWNMRMPDLDDVRRHSAGESDDMLDEESDDVFEEDSNVMPDRF